MTTKVLLAFLLAAFLLPLACSSEKDVHDTKEAIENPCVHCHQSAFAAASFPKHDGVFTQTCDECHTSFKAWTPIPKMHDLEPVKKKACVDCHLLDYTNAKDPDHVVGGFAKTCGDCHVAGTAWKKSG